MKVLLVEDDPLTLDATRTLLELEGHTVATACGARAALAAVARERPDVVVSDLLMAGGGGKDLLDGLAADPLPVLILTAATEEAVGKLLAGHPNVRVLTKPACPEDFLRTLAELASGSPIK